MPLRQRDKVQKVLPKEKPIGDIMADIITSTEKHTKKHSIKKLLAEYDRLNNEQARLDLKAVSNIIGRPGLWHHVCKIVRRILGARER